MKTGQNISKTFWGEPRKETTIKHLRDNPNSVDCNHRWMLWFHDYSHFWLIVDWHVVNFCREERVEFLDE
jgi:hypothetical protein